MSDAVTYGIELGVGLACLVISAASWRRDRWFRALGVALVVAGLSAIAHAVSRLI